jgi:hypothetical protein
MDTRIVLDGVTVGLLICLCVSVAGIYMVTMDKFSAVVGLLEKLLATEAEASDPSPELPPRPIYTAVAPTVTTATASGEIVKPGRALLRARLEQKRRPS